MNFLDIVLATVPVFMICAVGFVLRRGRVIDDDSEKSIMRLILLVLYPCFILSKIPGNDSLRELSVVSTALSSGFVLTLTGMLIAFGIAKALGISKEQGSNTFCLSTGIQNYGFLPIPLIEALFPRDIADETLGVLFVHNLGLEIALWTVGIIILSGTFKGSAKRLINGPTVAIAIGLFLNFAGLGDSIPVPIKSFLSQLGNCSIPISLVLVGATFCGVLQREKWKLDWKVALGAMVVRFLVMPAIFVSSALAVSFSNELSRILIVQSAMPSAVFPVVLAKHFGGKPGVAAQVVIVTTIASIVLTPILLTLGMKWISGG